MIWCHRRELTDAQIKALKSQDLLHVLLQSRKRQKVAATVAQAWCERTEHGASLFARQSFTRMRG